MNRQFDWKNIKKTDWLILGLIGAIMLVIMLPDGTGNAGGSLWGNTSDSNGAMQSTTGGVASGTKGTTIGNGGTASAAGHNTAEAYAAYLEEKLEDVLGEMEGVGKVKVMITLSDYGESVVEKDTVDVTSSVNETDSNGGSRNSFEREVQSETVQIENDSGTYPYVGKEILPTIEGIVVVAEGGGNATVVSQISKAAMALFPIEAHKIIVVKMSQGG